MNPLTAQFSSCHGSLGRLGLLWLFLLVTTIMHAAETNRILFSFATTNAVAGWQVVNDDVMGGISRSQFVAGTNGAAVFRGQVSLENNGGFASVRSQPAGQDLTRFNAFVIRVRGDGRRYKLTARTDAGFDSVLYQLPFITKAGECAEHRFAFAELVPTFRGRVLTDAPKFNAARFSSIGFLIADKQAGPFALEIEWIKAASVP